MKFFYGIGFCVCIAFGIWTLVDLMGTDARTVLDQLPFSYKMSALMGFLSDMGLIAFFIYHSFHGKNNE